MAEFTNTQDQDASHGTDFSLSDVEIQQLLRGSVAASVPIHRKINAYRPEMNHRILCSDYDTAYIMSDIHADFRKFIQTLVANDIISIPDDIDPYRDDDIYNTRLISGAKWRSEHTLCVVVGDLVDGKRPDNTVDDPRGCFELMILVFIYNMRIKARRMASDMIFTLGNHDLDGVLLDNDSKNENMWNNYVHNTAKTFFGNNMEQRKLLLQPLYRHSAYLFLDFIRDDGSVAIKCIHGGIHPEDGFGGRRVATAVLDNLQMALNADGFDVLRDPSNLNIAQTILWTRAADKHLHGICANLTERDPLLIVGHCPTNQLSDKTQSFLGLGTTDENHIYHGCDYYHHPRGENLRGCVVIGCKHAVSNAPKLILVDSGSSAAFRWDEKLYNDDTFPKSAKFHNKERDVEILKLSHTSGAAIGKFYYENIERQLNGVPYHFETSVTNQKKSEAASGVASLGGKKTAKKRHTKRRAKSARRRRNSRK